MKKMIVCAAVAMIAAFSQAASFKWAASGVTDGSSSISGTAVLMALIGDTLTTVDTTTMSGGAIVATDNVFESDDLVAGTTYQFKYEVTNDKGVFASTTKSSRAQANSTPTINFGSAGTWTASGGGVPEPTSALLLLMGGAMLALRRKRA